jgi:hypothetical protein
MTEKSRVTVYRETEKRLVRHLSKNYGYDEFEAAKKPVDENINDLLDELEE